MRAYSKSVVGFMQCKVLFCISDSMSEFFRVILHTDEYSRLGKYAVRENGSQFLSPVTNDASHRRWVSKHSLEMKTKGGRLDDSFYYVQ